MSTAQTTVEIDYPESDGQPMGETDLHRNWMIRLIDILQHRYRDQQVYVSGDLLVYYEEGNPRRFVVPDVFVVKDCDPSERRIYKLWAEPSAPHVVFEVTSRSSQREDTQKKPRIYAAIGVEEYFVFDPTRDYLNPPLRGFRLEDGKHEPIEPDADGWLMCQQLGFRCRVEGDELVLVDAMTGEKLVSHWEAEQLAREQSEAEVARLREELRRLRGDQQ